MSDRPQPQIQRYARGEVIFAEGSSGDIAYVVREGEVDITSGSAQQPVLLRTLSQGEMFGEMGLITANPRAASAVARTDVELEVIDRVAFTKLLQSDSEFALLTMKRLAGMVPEAQSRLLSAFKSQEQERDAKGSAARSVKQRDEVAAFEPDFVQIENEVVPAAIRAGGYAIAVFFIGAVAWATVAFTDTTVSGNGKVASTAANVTVAPFENGIVRQVNVKPGDLVKRGQVLATLDPTVSAADLESTRSQVVSTDAQVKRLQVELERSPAAPSFSPDKAEDAMQRQLHAARTMQFRAALDSHQEEIRNLEEQLKARREEGKEIERQLVVLRDISAVRKSFFEKERDVFQRDGPNRLQYLDAQRAQLQAERELTSSRNAVSSLEVQIRSRRAQRDAFVQDWRAKGSQELVTALREQSRLGEQFKKFDRAASLIEIVSPVDAIVLAVKASTPGAVLRAAESLFELVPVDVPLEFEVDISPRDVAQLQAGTNVYVKLDALPYVKHGMIDGKVRMISEDTFEKTLNGQPGPVYRVRIAMERMNLVNTPPGFRLVPGMTLTADLKVGTRTLITYFTYPILRSTSSSLREP